MPRKPLNGFELNTENEILISRETWERKAITTYRADYFDELTSLTWTKTKDGYLIANKLKNKRLHHYIMEKWHGEVNTRQLLDENREDP